MVEEVHGSHLDLEEVVASEEEKGRREGASHC
jgi:hypothetical protein